MPEPNTPSTPPAPLTAAQALADARSREAAGDHAGARAVLRRLVEEAPTPANVAAAARAWETWESDPLPNAPGLRLAVIGTGTLGPLGAHLRVATAGIGLHPAVHAGEFGQWAQELIDGGNALHSFAPEVIAVVLDPASLFPRIVREPFLSPEDEESERQSGLSALLRVLRAGERNAPNATFVLHTFAVPDYAPLGDVLDAQQPDGGVRGRIERLNRALSEAVRAEMPRVLLFDQERIEARFGKARVRDARRWYLASIPFSDDFLRALALEYLRILRPLKGLTRKCVVLDLDNTLWGGVIGEDGLAGIKLGGTAAPGNAFRDFQLLLNDLRQRGILLAVCSKNNPEDALPVFEQHPEIVLKRDHFAAIRINWDDKATNIAAIAKELNIGLDSLVFLDDNPAERGLVRERLPQVLTPDLPRDPAGYVAALRSLDVFESVALTEEDRRRSALYAEQRERRAFEAKLASAGSEGASEGGGGVTEHLNDLGIVVRLGPATPFTLPRIAQLINKTNQFNLTTRRYTEAEVRAMADDPANWGVFSASVSDRFGDSGLTGVAITHRSGDEVWEVDSFLLSCRVLGRGIEQALLRYAAEQARAAGAKKLSGQFLPTAKNAPSADFYGRMGFGLSADNVGENGESAGGGTSNGARTYSADLSAPDAMPEPLQAYPAYLTVIREENTDGK